MHLDMQPVNLLVIDNIEQQKVTPDAFNLSHISNDNMGPGMID